MWHRDPKWSNAFGRNVVDRLVGCSIARNLQFVKNTLFEQHNYAENNKMSYACTKKKSKKGERKLNWIIFGKEWFWDIWLLVKNNCYKGNLIFIWLI